MFKVNTFAWGKGIISNINKNLFTKDDSTPSVSIEDINLTLHINVPMEIPQAVTEPDFLVFDHYGAKCGQF